MDSSPGGGFGGWDNRRVRVVVGVRRRVAVVVGIRGSERGQGIHIEVLISTLI